MCTKNVAENMNVSTYLYHKSCHLKWFLICYFFSRRVWPVFWLWRGFVWRVRRRGSQARKEKEKGQETQTQTWHIPRLHNGWISHGTARFHRTSYAPGTTICLRAGPRLATTRLVIFLSRYKYNTWLVYTSIGCKYFSPHLLDLMCDYYTNVILLFRPHFFDSLVGFPADSSKKEPTQK